MITGDCPRNYKNCPTLLLLDKLRNIAPGVEQRACAECGAVFTGLSLGGADLFWTIAPQKKKRATRRGRPSTEMKE